MNISEKASSKRINVYVCSLKLTERKEIKQIDFPGYSFIKRNLSKCSDYRMLLMIIYFY